MNGHEFLMALRDNHDYDHTRVVMVTTETEMEYVAKALDTGANEYVMKPFDREIIVSKLALIGLVNA